MPKDAKEKIPKVPVDSLGDRVHAVMRSGLGAIPIAGQAAIELFGALVAPPLAKRRDEWMRDVGEMLAKLSEKKHVNLEDLQQNDAFLDLLMDASQAAIRNANQEKRKALQNAIRNAALGQGPEEALQHMFIRWVDELTDRHLRILHLFRDPEAWATINGRHLPTLGALSDVLTDAFPELKRKREFYDQVWRDLYTRGLVNTDQPHTTMSSAGLSASRLTDTGTQFLQFIEVDE